MARALEKLRSRQMALNERAVPVTTADREFDRIWYGQCADEMAPKPVASAPEHYEMVALLESSPQRVRGAIRMTVKAHQKRFPNRSRPQSQRPSSQMRSLCDWFCAGDLLSAKPVERRG